jgi:serine/threonine-protein kinase HipA
MNRRICVYVDLDGATHFVGYLWARQNKGRESASFEYAKDWLSNPQRFALEPALALGTGAFHTNAGHKIFGAIGDSAPDRWGRVLIQRAERQKARDDNRPPRTINELDYLLGVGDIARQGALRFCLEPGSPFLSEETIQQIPPLIELPRLLGAAERFSAEEETAEDIRLLLAPGSSLGGARPKASVIDRDGQLAIAKFPKNDDDIRVSLWEALALSLAAKAGIPTPEWRLETINDKSVLILKRFDRQNGTRLPYLSSMSMLGAIDNETHSYMEIADALRQYGSHAEQDCAQLWRRIVFNILISNTDDHLRNHGFVFDKTGWTLSPAFDLNPVPIDIRPRNLSTAIDEADTTASLEIAFEVAKHFGLKPDAAKAIAKEVGNIVATWHDSASSLGLTAKEIERMSSAFEHEDLAKSQA